LDWDKAAYPVQALDRLQRMVGSGVKPDTETTAFIVVRERSMKAGIEAELKRVSEAVTNVTANIMKLCQPRSHTEMLNEEIKLVKHTNDLVDALDQLSEAARPSKTDVSLLFSIIPPLIAVFEAQGIYDRLYTQPHLYGPS
jgi:hypothetical protein